MKEELIRIVCVGLFWSLSGCAVQEIAPPSTKSEGKFREGVHYQRLANAAPARHEPMRVIEFFSYACDSCTDLDAYLGKWAKQSKPDRVKFSRVPLITDEISALQGRVYFTAEALGQEALIHRCAYRYSLQHEADAMLFFTEHGIDAREFNAAFDSSETKLKLQRATALAETHRVTSAPTIIINDRYRTDAAMAGGQEELIMLISRLLATDAEAARTAGLAESLQGNQ